MKTLLIAAAMILLPTAASAAPSLTGTWAVSGAVSSMGVNFSLACHLTQTGAKLSGPCKDPQPPADVQLAGSVSGANVNWAYDVSYMGVAVHMVYTGVIAPTGNGMAGGILANNSVQGTFTAARR